ncbi:hypothetical protein F5J12DRAFT_784923 [Pisolithus orientalis]|uniref:uncharacterized protein n=1 Tax=Pisolithus orientalis TaxID=936130 RepID=UPI002225AE25|nr:uncharacterized protein F5J12DRAFT_784923 [Pisolithus orientalis]KAI5998338.1 hypothetical protein F5J12DRAFT_784923 [Pisolithus orientalis]
MPVSVKYLSAKIISTSSLPGYSLMEHVWTSVSQNCIHIVFARVLLNEAHIHLWYFSMEHICIPPIVEDGDVHVCITCCLWLVHIFHIDCCKPSDLKPAYTVDAVHQLHGEFHLNHEAFEWVLDEIEAKFNHTLVNPGGMCSTVAAQSIGEPATQMTLNAFHYANVSSKNATLSVPCLKEIINVATNIKTLSPSVYLESYMAQDKKTPLTLNTFHHTGVYNRNAKLGIPHLKEIINIATWYDPNPTSTIIKDSVNAMLSIPCLKEIINVTTNINMLSLSVDLMRKSSQSSTFSHHGTFGWCLTMPERLIGVLLWLPATLLGASRWTSSSSRAKITWRNGQGTVEEDIFLCQFKNTTLNLVSLHSVPTSYFCWSMMRGASRQEEQVLETDGINLKVVICLPDIDFTHMYLNSQCIEASNALGIAVAHAAIMKKVQGVIEFGGSYMNYCHLSLFCNLMTYCRTPMAITPHGIDHADTGTLVSLIGGETVGILMEAAGHH